MRIDGRSDRWQSQVVPAAVEKTSTLEVHLPVDVLSTIQRAAEIQGGSLEEFLIEAAHRQARELVERETTVQLDRNETRWVFSMLENPPEPSTEILEAVAAHRKLIRGKN